ncbi:MULTISPECIES: MinD/ParA family protein [Leptospira]|uniref:Putative flagellar biosynthesis protein FlhG n=4 Tax=Leptospira weilii TaxID=28184 RepID=A0A828Z3K9_9LEPT|nr:MULTISPECIES: MinD/ParA family protein [Leptospira]EMM73325.1 putative flagellar biosynthesis protein FlhG [Leptospira weilii str. 2006001855]EMY16308.1 putative flagellar biosynthesis protein FlhG [Leptospira weilii str. Ecochallenge]EKR64551.1 putative flagellar biosynthesis protein FlhG [Leptospira weilii str. 2006001853]EMJ62767.1 putative flagellar biosynthesis protein FlhG [Leptospira sp. P2653]EMN45096.1 putative flagellar biosynthesis protein FlhG [Leptospira weilii str. LNT 1234]
MDQAAHLRKLTEGNTSLKVLSSRKPRTKIVAIASGKGGVGKSTISVNLAISMARAGQKVLVFDGDLGLANVNVILGIIPKYNLYHVVKGHKSLKDIVIQTPEGVDIIAGASGYSQLANLNDTQRNSLIKGFSELDNYDVMIIDTGAGISSNVIGLTLPADDVIVITTPEPTAITDSYGLIKAIVSQSRDKNLKMVVNRVRSAIEGKKVADRVIDISGQFLEVKVENLGFIFQDEEVEKSIREQKPYIISSPKSKAAACLNRITYSLLNQEIEPLEDSGISGFFKKFFNFMDVRNKEFDKSDEE